MTPVFDKLPSTPTRVGGPTAARVLAAAAGVFPAVAAGALGAIAGTIAGSVWREYAAQRGWDVAGAVAEDVASLALTLYAVRG